MHTDEHALSRREILKASAAAFDEWTKGVLARNGGDKVSFPITGFEGGSVSRRCVTLA